MIKVFKDDVLYKEFFSIYNAIEFLQKEVFWVNPPEVAYGDDKKVSFESGPNTFTVQLEFETQRKTLIKWIESFFEHSGDEFEEVTTEAEDTNG